MVKFKQKGSVLIVALFVSSIIFVAGLGFASQTRFQYQQAWQSGRAAEALAIAEAGLEDTLSKLRNDLDFPPKSADDQLKFSFEDTLSNSRDEIVGSYQVDIDRTAVLTEHKVMVVRSKGRLGPSSAPLAERTLEIELDVDPTRSTYYEVLNWSDLGGF